MQSMFDTGETENQLVFAEMLHFRAVNFRYHIENRPLLVAQCVYTLSRSCSMAIPNFIALFALSGVVAKLTKDYFGSKSTLKQ